MKRWSCSWSFVNLSPVGPHRLIISKASMLLTLQRESPDGDLSLMVAFCMRVKAAFVLVERAFRGDGRLTKVP